MFDRVGEEGDATLQAKLQNVKSSASSENLANGKHAANGKSADFINGFDNAAYVSHTHTNGDGSSNLVDDLDTRPRSASELPPGETQNSLHFDPVKACTTTSACLFESPVQQIRLLQNMTCTVYIAKSS